MRPVSILLLVTLAACSEPPAPVAVPSPSAEVDAKAADTKAADAKAETKAQPQPKPKPVVVEPTWESQLAALDRRIEGHRKVAERNGRSSLAFGRLAELMLARARLTGDYDDYADAEEVIEKGFTVGPKDFGPFMTRARLNYTLHRLDRVDEDFTRATRLPTSDGDELFRRGLFAANLAFQRGQYEQAKQGLQQLVEAEPTALPALAGLALYHWKAGEFDQAEPLYQRAIESYRGDEAEPKAWLHLQLGLMDLDRGRHDEALAHYREGEALIRGFWLIDEHIAEILTLQGATDPAKTEQAKALYLDIIERTGNPEFMDAMAGIHLAAGEEAQAKEWIAKANAKFEAQLQRFPEAAYGHALEHFLEFGDDPAKALDMAQKNHALRPNADAKRLLAEAQLAAGKASEAKAMVEQALATPMRSADLHATAAAVYAANGDEGKAKEHRAAARAIDPTIELPEGE
ncbi:tetratricopeptide repeat protein [Paraliomyxa miuraensis]|uniref:tetratricopeptide repeat protein n=1 Tax=Paraliomyxa miuraensis TaxID=376150 RepID=UPI002253802C|nr:tetratricopeptide repeat protein [Paraliomyxa miuraensis]